MNFSIEQLKEIIQKPDAHYPDVDLRKYGIDIPNVKEDLVIHEDIKVSETAQRVGFKDTLKLNYLQVNEDALYKSIEKELGKYNVKVMPLKLALEKLHLVKDLSWSLIKPITDKYTAAAYLFGGELGYFIYVPPNTKVPIPIYTCLVITSNNKVQFAHNIVYVDEGSEAHVVTGCGVPHGIRDSVHIGISEFYVAKNAKLTFSMIHAWSRGLHVRPRTAVNVEKGGEYVSYYIIYSPVSSLQTDPLVYLSENAKAYMASVIVGKENGIYDVGARAVLNGVNASVEVISRVVASNESETYARSEIAANASNTKGHVECLGLLLSEKARISSIPTIISRNPNAKLTHEAAIGIIAQEELEYLMSKGFSENEAKAILIRGFMNIDAPGIPVSIKAEADRILDMVSKYAVG